MSAARYALYGFTLESELSLPAAPASAAPEGEGGAVQVRFASIPPREGERLWTEEEGGGGTGGALVFDVAEVGRYRIAGGREILIDPAGGASERNLRVYLLGSAMGALLHQRGLLPLHANAVEINGQAVAFSGKSGAGKSTLAAWFADRGHRILCDDVCAIAPGTGGGPPLVLPGVPRLRLWEDAVAASGRSAGDYERSFDGQDKYDVPAGNAAAARPLPLAACYMIERPEAGSEAESRTPGIARLLGVEAVDALVANTYRGRFATVLGLTRPHLGLCLGIAARTPVHAAARRWGHDLFDAEAARLRDHAAQIIKEKPFPKVAD
ncbi:MAG TPA: hypothetical protein VF552_02965 [Allosphingosinicella sp.]